MENKRFNFQSGKFTVLINIVIILIIAFVGIIIAYLSTAIFTKHGQEAKVPGVENMSYTRAIEVLHSKGFNVDIRDSLFRDDIKPGYVIEQFPKANSIVKPGRKIFLYINAVHPKEVVIDDGANRAMLALKDWSYRQVKSRLTELGFKNIRTVTVLGATDRVVKLLANGKPIYQMQKVPVNARIIIEVSDGRLNTLRDSLYNLERLSEYNNEFGDLPGGEFYGEGTGENVSSESNQDPQTFDEPEYFEEPEYFLINE